MDKISFTSMVLKEERYFKSFIRKRLYSVEDLEDAYQATLLEAYRFRANFRGDSTPRVWVCGIANHVVIRFNKQYVSNKDSIPIGEHSEQLELLQTSSHNASGISEVESCFSMKEMWETVESSLDGLNGDLKGVFSDVILRGESYKGVAVKYSIPIGTVKSRISKVRKHLKAECGLDNQE